MVEAKVIIDGEEVESLDLNDVRVLHGACEHAIESGPNGSQTEYEMMAARMSGLAGEL